MKFSNGQWLTAKGFHIFGACQVSEVIREDKKVTVIMPAHRNKGRGDTLGGVTLTLEITSPRPDMIALKASHFMGTLNNEPAFELDTDYQPLTVTEEDDGSVSAVDLSSGIAHPGSVAVQAGRSRVVINKDNGDIEFYFDDELKCKSQGSRRDLAYVLDDYTDDAYVSNDQPHYMRQCLSIGVGEQIYGLGEQFTPLVRNGQSLTMWNADAGTSSDQGYKNIPFYLSSRSYGIFVNSSDKVSFEVGSEYVDKVEFSVPDQHLEYVFIGGSSPKDVLSRYTDLTGKPGLPPAWSFGLWLSTSFTTNYDEKTVMSFIDGMQERGIPLRVFHFDCFWMKGNHWSDFLFDPAVFPDPKGMLSRIKAKGLKICVWINPYIAQASRLFKEGAQKGYFLKRPDGSVWQWDMWQSGMAIVDFTNPQAKAWYQSKLDQLLDLGVDCFKTDFGERIPVDCVYYNGADPRSMHNYYTYLYNQAVYQVLQKRKGGAADNEPNGAVLFARSATAGSQKFSVHWGGDCWANYPSMEQSLRAGLSLLSSGFGFWSHDIGGFEDTSTPDVYKRWCALGLLSSHSRLHGSSSYRVPWAYDKESVDVLRFFTRLKASLMPYLYQCAVETHQSGVGLMRPMFLEFPEDRSCRYLANQYMLGPSLLVAPVMDPQGIVEYYLPSGIWTDYFTGQTCQGGCWKKEKVSYLDIPLWVRQGAVLAVGQHEDRADYDYADNVTLKVYQPQEKETVTVTVPDLYGRVDSQFEVTTLDGVTKVSRVKGSKPYQIRIFN